MATSSKTTSINLPEVTKDAIAGLESIGHKGGVLDICVPMDPHLRSHLDVAQAYLEVAFIGQQMSKAGTITGVRRREDYPEKSVTITLQYSVPRELMEKLDWLRGLYDDPDETNDRYVDVRESLADFDEELQNYNTVVALPDYADLYFANLIASHYDWSGAEKEEVLSRNPEWRFHVWKSAWSPKLGIDLFVSPTFWLLPAETDPHLALKSASTASTEGMTFSTSVRVFSDTQQILVLTESEVVVLPLSIHLEASRAAEVIFPVDIDTFWNTRYAWGLEHCFQLSGDMSCIRCIAKSFQYILFRDVFRVLAIRDINSIADKVQQLAHDLLTMGGTSTRKECDWSRLNDESFELLCYDLVIRDGRFSKERTSKMGVSKSRDSGRDIVTEEVSRAGQPLGERRRWIVQCKFSLRGKSLGRRAVRISELIDEFDPVGIVIASNMLIDAGTYDLYDKIQQKRGVTIECWDRLQIERRLSQHVGLMPQYLNSSHTFTDR